VTVGIDLGSHTVGAIEWVRRLRELGTCDVRFLHALSPAALWSELPIAEITEREIQEQKIGLLPGQGRVELRIQPGLSEAHTLARYAREAGSDLVIIPAARGHWHPFGGSLSGLVREAGVPVLCAPAPAAMEQPTPRFRRILAPTDFSTMGNEAIRSAYGMVGEGPGTVTICHVLTPYRAVDEETRRDRAHLAARLRGLAPGDVDGSRISTHVAVLESAHTAEALAAEAVRVSADAICIGSHGRRGITGAFVGSIASDLVARSTVPVLVVGNRRVN
jgi:nucleotide-binding universal stress UspA family protein